jgi:hypothetical protein
VASARQCIGTAHELGMVRYLDVYGWIYLGGAFIMADRALNAYASEAGHWYLPDGTPFYTYTNKYGEEKNVTLRQARPKLAVPSYSMISGCAAAPQLDRWKINQVLLAGAALPRDDFEGDQAWMDRVLARSRETSETARDLGTIIHGCIEKHLCGESVPVGYGEYVLGAIEGVDMWCGLEGIRPERSFCHPLGFGGKCDVHKKPSIDLNDTHNGYVADFKTKDFTADRLPDVYDNHFMQLAAYREGFEMPQARCAIIYVSTAVPGLTHLVEVEQAELERGWGMFCALLTYWQHKNRYFPTQQALAA